MRRRHEVVYRAFDSHLNRSVAIQVLRAEVMTGLERKRRFVQEAPAASGSAGSAMYR